MSEEATDDKHTGPKRRTILGKGSRKADVKTAVTVIENFVEGLNDEECYEALEKIKIKLSRGEIDYDAVLRLRVRMNRVLSKKFCLCDVIHFLWDEMGIAVSESMRPGEYASFEVQGMTDDSWIRLLSEWNREPDIGDLGFLQRVKFCECVLYVAEVGKLYSECPDVLWKFDSLFIDGKGNNPFVADIRHTLSHPGISVGEDGTVTFRNSLGRNSERPFVYSTGMKDFIARVGRLIELVDKCDDIIQFRPRIRRLGVSVREIMDDCLPTYAESLTATIETMLVAVETVYGEGYRNALMSIFGEKKAKELTEAMLGFDPHDLKNQIMHMEDQVDKWVPGCDEGINKRFMREIGELAMMVNMMELLFRMPSVIWAMVCVDAILSGRVIRSE